MFDFGLKGEDCGKLLLIKQDVGWKICGAVGPIVNWQSGSRHGIVYTPIHDKDLLQSTHPTATDSDSDSVSDSDSDTVCVFLIEC